MKMNSKRKKFKFLTVLSLTFLLMISLGYVGVKEFNRKYKYYNKDVNIFEEIGRIDSAFGGGGTTKRAVVITTKRTTKYKTNNFISVNNSTQISGNNINNKGAITSVNISMKDKTGEIKGKLSGSDGNAYVAAKCNGRSCPVQLHATVSNKEDEANIVWYKDGKLTNITGANPEIFYDATSGKASYVPCIKNKTCPGTINSAPSGDNNGNSGSGSGGNYGGGSGGQQTPSATQPVSVDKYPDKINKDVFAKNKEYSGSSINCGDKIHVTACNSDSDPICIVTSINGKEVQNTFIKKSNYTENESETGCYQNLTRYVKKDSYYYSDSNLTNGKQSFPCGEQVTLKGSLSTVCNDKSCEAIFNGKVVYLDKNSLINYKPVCTNDPEGTCVSSANQTNVTGNITIKICNGEDNSEKRNKIVSCANGYKKSYKVVNDKCGESTSATCYREYEYSCIFGKAPGVSASAGILDSNGFGIINITGYDYGNVGLKGYFISAGYAPSVNSSWKGFDSNNKATEKQPAGTYYIWAKNTKEIMSNSVLVKVYDADLSSTMKAFGIVDENTGDILSIKQTDNRVANVNQIVDAKYALLSNRLIADSTATGFDQLTTSYELTTTSNKIGLYATLTSDDANYVKGFEPRTVDLEYGENAVVIAIVNKDGKQRNYTFIVNRVDDRNNDNTLSNIKLSKGKINFDPYVTNYDVEIGKNTKKVSINAELNNLNAGFVVGYEPRTVEITEDKQSAVIKVMSEAGNVRSYVITFIKKDYVEEPGNSAYLSSLTVPGTQLSFDKENYNYTITVPYETDRVPVYAFAESENANVNVGDSTNLGVGTNLVEIEVKNGKNTKIYNLYIIRKGAGLDVSNSTNLSMLSIKGYNLNFDPNVLDYTVKIKREKTLMIAATPESNRADLYMYGNNDLTGFSTVRVKVIAENGLTQIYSIDIQKDAYNKKLEIIAASVGGLIIVISSIIIVVTKNKKKKAEYLEG